MSKPMTSNQAHAAQTVITSIDSQILIKDQAKQPPIDIKNLTTVASFTWLDSTSPSIAIPGLPPRWTPPRIPVQLQQDKGDYFRDQNAARFSEHPMLPAVQAIFKQSSDIETKEIDLFACSSTLGNLIRFARGTPKPFRFRVEVVGKTAFFVRQESSPTLLIQDVYGYGHTFPEAYTTWDKSVRGSESHQRVIKYMMAGKEMLVRFEADGYLPEKADEEPGSKQSPTAPESQNLDLDLAQLGVGTVPVQSDSLQVVTKGHSMQHEALFDLKTRSFKKMYIDVVGEELPRLWINQIPNFVLAFHRAGTFHDIRVLDVRDRFRLWQRDEQKALRMFSALIDRICRTAMQRSDSKLEVSWDEGSGLQLRTLPEKWDVLPAGLKAAWTGGVKPS